MDTRGKFAGMTRDFMTGRVTVSFELTRPLSEAQIAEIKDIEDLDIKAEKHRKKRSLDANAYAWVLMQKIAEIIKSDKWSVYIELLQRYSRAFTHVIVKPEAVDMMKSLYRTCIELGEVTVNGKTGVQLQVYYGSSTFDSKQMSVFVDGIVSECKGLGIETMTPDEIERMKQQWQRKENQ